MLKKFIEKHIEQGHALRGQTLGENELSRNPSITPEFIGKHNLKPWDWGSFGLSSNTFSVAERRTERNKAARIIQIKFLDWFINQYAKTGHMD
jgi:hypothetical protein